MDYVSVKFCGILCNVFSCVVGYWFGLYLNEVVLFFISYCYNVFENDDEF